MSFKFLENPDRQILISVVEHLACRIFKILTPSIILNLTKITSETTVLVSNSTNSNLCHIVSGSFYF